MSVKNQVTCLYVLTSSALNRGMNTGCENLVWGLAEKGVVIHILAGGNRPATHNYKIPKNVHYHFTGVSGENPISFVPAFLEIIEKYEINVVLGWIINIAALAATVNNREIRFIASLGQMPPRSIFLRFFKRALLGKMHILDVFKLIFHINNFPERSEKIVSNSNAVQSASISAYRLSTDKCSVIPRGIDTNIYDFCEKNREPSRFNLLFSGNVHKPKGIGEIVSALEFIPFPITITLCGNGDKTYIEFLENKVKSFAVNHALVYAGALNQEELVKYYHDCDIFVFPSYWEGMPKALLEAMSCGCPVICSDIAPHREIMQHGENGLMVPVKSPTNLANAILKYIENPELRESCAINARKTIEDRFKKEQEIDNWLQVLNSAS